MKAKEIVFAAIISACIGASLQEVEQAYYAFVNDVNNEKQEALS